MNAPEESRKTHFNRLGIEFVVIVAGVFLALVTESWWSERDERKYEIELRSDMVEEFRENLAILESDLENNLAVVAKFADFTEVSTDELLSMPDSAFEPWSAQELDWAGFDPMMGSTQALVQSGNLNAIADRTLRLRLSTWAGLLEEKTRFTSNAVNFQSAVFFPAAARFGADGVWSPAERREFRSLLRTMQYRMETTVKNQVRLRLAAQELVDYLEQ